METEGHDEAKEGAEPITGDQGDWSQAPSTSPGVGAGDPNTPVSTSGPPPAGQVGSPDQEDVRTGEGQAEDAQRQPDAGVPPQPQASDPGASGEGEE